MPPTHATTTTTTARRLQQHLEAAPPSLLPRRPAREASGRPRGTTVEGALVSRWCRSSSLSATNASAASPREEEGQRRSSPSASPRRTASTVVGLEAPLVLLPDTSSLDPDPVVVRTRHLTAAMARDATDVATNAAFVEQRTSFERRLHLPYLGIRLAVDEPNAAFTPARQTGVRCAKAKDRRDRGGGSRDAHRVQLAEYLFKETAPTTPTKGGKQAAVPDDAVPPPSWGPARRERDADAAAVDRQRTAAVAQMTLDAFASLPPGVLEATPYLSFLQERAQVEAQVEEIEQQQGSVQSDEGPPSRSGAGTFAEAPPLDEADLFRGFAAFLRDEGGEQSEAATKAAFQRYIVSKAQQPHAREGKEAERNPRQEVNGEAATQQQRGSSSPPAPPPTDAPASPQRRTGPTSGGPPRPPSGSKPRPTSAAQQHGLLMHAAQKRLFLTELVGRAASLPNVDPDVEASTPAGGGDGWASPTAAIFGPPLAAWTPSAIESVRQRRAASAGRSRTAEAAAKAATALQESAQLHAETAVVAQLRSAVRSARRQQGLVHRSLHPAAVTRPPQEESNPASIHRTTSRRQRRDDDDDDKSKRSGRTMVVAPEPAVQAAPTTGYRSRRHLPPAS